MITARCCLAWLGAGGRWLPTWLPGEPVSVAHAGTRVQHGRGDWFSPRAFTLRSWEGSRCGTASWTDRTLIASGWCPPEERLRYYARQFPLVEGGCHLLCAARRADRGAMGRANPARLHLQRQGVQPVHRPPRPGGRAA